MSNLGGNARTEPGCGFLKVLRPWFSTHSPQASMQHPHGISFYKKVVVGIVVEMDIIRETNVEKSVGP